MLNSLINRLRGPIYFYAPDDGTEQSVLSNYSAHQLALPHNDRVALFPSVEHYYQSRKFDDTDAEWAEVIRSAETPQQATKMGRSRWHPVDPHWSDINLQVMMVALCAKYRQHPAVSQFLVSTDPRRIVCTARHDEFLGVGRQRRGLNLLGALWQSVREHKGMAWSSSYRDLVEIGKRRF